MKTTTKLEKKIEKQYNLLDKKMSTIWWETSKEVWDLFPKEHAKLEALQRQLKLERVK